MLERGLTSDLPGQPSWRVALFAGLDGHGKPILHRRQRAGGVKRIGAGGVLKPIEVERQCAWLIDPVIRQASMQVAGGFIRGSPAGRISEQEEEDLRSGDFDYRFETQRGVAKPELGDARRRQIESGAEDGRDFENARRSEWLPESLDAKFGIGRIPVEAMKGGARGGVSVFDTEREAVSASENGER